MLTISGVGDRPSGELTKSGSSNHALNFASDLLTAEGGHVHPLRRFGHAALLHQQLQTEQQIEIGSVVMDFFV